VSIIEAAARRLEQLRSSGIAVPTPRAPDAGVLAAEIESLPARMARQLAQSREPIEPARAAAQADHAAPVLRSKSIHIDRDRLAAMGYVNPDAPRTRIADEFRSIKRQLLRSAEKLAAAGSKRANLIMVTSSVPSEGKTFVSVNLAMSLALEMDKTVLLVDADVSRPSVLSRLGVDPAKGWLDILDDPTIPMSDVLLRTDIDSLTLLPAGARNARATEHLASNATGAMLDEMAHRYSDRIIIFDAPPLLASSEAHVLASAVGQVVFVVEAERTPQRVVERALSIVEDCPVVLPLLNKAADLGAGSFYYGDYPAYGG
jgi:exopolysaccharide/PEP-CTERM locus tyrosine autokinase